MSYFGAFKDIDATEPKNHCFQSEQNARPASMHLKSKLSTTIYVKHSIGDNVQLVTPPVCCDGNATELSQHNAGGLNPS